MSVTSVSPGYTTPANLRSMGYTRRPEFFRDLPDFDVLERTKRFENVFTRNPHEAKAFIVIVSPRRGIRVSAERR